MPDNNYYTGSQPARDTGKGPRSAQVHLGRGPQPAAAAQRSQLQAPLQFGSV